MNNFKIVTSEFLEKANLVYYAGGKKLKEGDLVISGLVIGSPTTISRIHSYFYSHDDASHVTLCMFVLDQETKMLHHLYAIK